MHCLILVENFKKHFNLTILLRLQRHRVENVMLLLKCDFGECDY